MKKQQINKSKKLNNVCYDIRGPVLAKADELISNGENILKLNIGNPAIFGLCADENLLETAIKNIDKAQAYCDSKGLLSAREAILNQCQNDKFKNTEIKDIILGNGVSELITISLQALLDDGDEVLIPSPDYPLWTAATNLAGGVPIHYICEEENNWQPSISDIKSKVTNKTKAIVLINPNNPTGSVYTKDNLLSIAKIARDNGLIVFADEIYDKILYDDSKHVPFASLADDLLCITFNGLSKSYRLAGFRSGWLIISGKKENAKDYIIGLNMLASMRLCANVQSQFIIPVALKHDKSIYNLTLNTGRLGRQMNIAYKMVNAIDGISCTRPQGAIYLFVKMDKDRYNIKDDEQMMLDLLIQQKILLVHGRAFNWKDPDHFRIVFLPEEKQLIDAINRLEIFLKGYQQ